ncbi:hypothetical protein KSP40_PGU011506 [Platanthera guangdongensis]|uniref:Pentatricopeptide repeat-containing protein n=1 Tax=Platanthera guangdongensis TaxID=2320717 RepID=A0ABR2N5X5_9ASPA
MVLRIGWNPANVPAYDSFLNTMLSHDLNGFDEAPRWLYRMKENGCLVHRNLRPRIHMVADDVEEVLKLSYSHLGAAVKFFRWSGTWLQNRHSPYSWNLVVDILDKDLPFESMWDVVRFMHSEGFISLATFASIFSPLTSAGRPADALAAIGALAPHGIP